MAAGGSQLLGQAARGEVQRRLAAASQQRLHAVAGRPVQRRLRPVFIKSSIVQKKVCVLCCL